MEIFFQFSLHSLIAHIVLYCIIFILEILLPLLKIMRALEIWFLGTHYR